MAITAIFFLKTIRQYKEDFAKLKSDIQQMERHDVAEVKSANERLKAEIEKLRKTLHEEITRSQAGVRLDLNLEKGRIRDETIEQHERLRKTDDKIENEILALKRQMEGIKLQILQYMIGTITGAGTLVLGKKDATSLCRCCWEYWIDRLTGVTQFLAYMHFFS